MKNWFHIGTAQRVGVGVILSLALSPSFAAAQNSSESTGARFVSAGEKSDTIQQVGPPGCQVISENAEQTISTQFCPKDSGWVLVSDRYGNGPHLYQFSEAHLASASVAVMDGNALDQLTQDDVRQLIDLHIYQNGPRGQMQVEEVLVEDIGSVGNLIGKTTIVTNTDGQKLLHQISVSKLSTGLGFFETSQSIANTSGPYDLSKTQADLHDSFMNTISVKYSMVRTWNDQGQMSFTLGGPRQ